MHTTQITTLATFLLQHQDDATLGLVDSPVTVEALDEGPGTRATFQVCRDGELLSTDIQGTMPAVFDTAAEAMAWAVDFCGWGAIAAHLA